jgi:2-dehydro-3-deoxyphosphogalactonate aldolase
VIAATVSAGIISSPGYFTVTEAFTALDAGAHLLKLFPAEGAAPAVLKAHRAVLPKTVPVLPVGGITTEIMASYIAAGADGFGLGSALFKPGVRVESVHANATAFVRQWRHLHSERDDG